METTSELQQEGKEGVRPSTTERVSTQELPVNDPKKLVGIIKQQQHDNVKESHGEYVNQCFTDEDLKRFVEGKKTVEITKQLKKNNHFLETVLAVKKMRPSERQNLIDECLKISRPTWAELGRISREGQTEAGQQAERMIAKAIVDLVEELFELSDDEIKHLAKS
jgi:hypothetical protein